MVSRLGQAAAVRLGWADRPPSRAPGALAAVCGLTRSIWGSCRCLVLHRERERPLFLHTARLPGRAIPGLDGGLRCALPLLLNFGVVFCCGFFFPKIKSIEIADECKLVSIARWCRCLVILFSACVAGTTSGLRFSSLPYPGKARGLAGVVSQPGLPRPA